MKTKCIIVDDEPLAIEAIRMHIQKTDSLKLVGTCSDAIKAFDLLRNTSVDLMFLDIEMPEMTGLEFLKSLKNPPKVILTTAYREYAVQAFDLDVIDYLLKPVSFTRFLQAVHKYFDAIPQNAIKAISVHPYSGVEEYFFVKADKKNVKIRYREVLYVEGIKDYVKIVCIDRTIVSKLMIGNMIDILPEDQFIRIHRSYIICIPNINAYSSTSVEVHGKEIPIGRNYKHETLNTLRQ
ncbi:MAG: response regulator transcription factor [Cytophagales bacterium]|nr:response regulator transcription factor [Cytophagales bacterium]